MNSIITSGQIWSITNKIVDLKVKELIGFFINFWFSNVLFVRRFGISTKKGRNFKVEGVQTVRKGTLWATYAHAEKNL